jgi:hypothetical protein
LKSESAVLPKENEGDGTVPQNEKIESPQSDTLESQSHTVKSPAQHSAEAKTHNELTKNEHVNDTNAVSNADEHTNPQSEDNRDKVHHANANERNLLSIPMYPHWSVCTWFPLFELRYIRNKYQRSFYH